MPPAIISDESNWRFEYKYRLPLQKYLQVRNAIQPYMEVDEFTRIAPSGRYLVRSLYFDSIFLKAFEEKIDGNSDRIKLRIRTYSDKPNPPPTIRVEMKVRKNAITEKYGARITAADYHLFMKCQHWQDTVEPVLAEFERYIHLYTQRPQILVAYRREGYSPRTREELRVTFDHDVKSAHADSLFPAAPLFHAHHPGIIILEIKCNKNQPEWLRKMVQEHGLRVMANSKYVQGMMVSYPAMVTPSWSA